MASIEQRGKSFRIVFRFRGQKYSRSLHTRKEREATAALCRLEDNLRRVELGTLVVPEEADPAVFLLSDGRIESKPKPKRLIRLLGDLCDAYLASLPERSIEATTRHCLAIHVGHFKRELGEQFRIQGLGLADLQLYVDKRSRATGRRGKPLSAGTIRKEVATLNTIWAWAQEYGYVEHPLPKKSLRYPKTAEKPPFQTMDEIERKVQMGSLTDSEIEDLWDSVFLTLPEIDQLLEYVRANAMHAFVYPMFVFAAHTGARRSEMRRSRIHDVDLDACRVTVRERKRARGRNTTRLVPLTPFLADVLKKWFAEHPGSVYTFPIEPDVPKTRKRRTTPQPITCEEAGHHFQQALRGSKWRKLRGWHVFRHSFCSNCAAAGTDQRIIDDWVGHQTEEMRRRYRHLIPNQQLAEIHRIFGQTGRFLRIHNDAGASVADACKTSKDGARGRSA